MGEVVDFVIKECKEVIMCANCDEEFFLLTTDGELYCANCRRQIKCSVIEMELVEGDY